MNPETQASIEREFFIDNLLVRIHLIIVMIWWTGLAPWDFEFPFPGSLTSTFLDQVSNLSATPRRCHSSPFGGGGALWGGRLIDLCEDDNASQREGTLHHHISDNSGLVRGGRGGGGSAGGGGGARGGLWHPLTFDSRVPYLRLIDFKAHRR